MIEFFSKKNNPILFILKFWLFGFFSGSYSLKKQWSKYLLESCAPNTSGFQWKSASFVDKSLMKSMLKASLHNSTDRATAVPSSMLQVDFVKISSPKKNNKQLVLENS